MTTIAVRAGVMAADRLLDGWQAVGKIFRLKDGSLLGGAGNYDDILETVAWLNAGAKPDARPEIPADANDFVLLDRDGAIYWLTDPFLRRVLVTEQFYAIGTGSKVALGAMDMGASAKRAVEAACRYDESTGLGVDVVKVKRK